VPALGVALAALAALAQLRADQGPAVNWLAWIACLWLAFGFGAFVLPPLERAGEWLGWAFARPQIEAARSRDRLDEIAAEQAARRAARREQPGALICPGVAMPTGHSLTRTYSRPPGLLFRYQVSDRCWHCDYAQPYPATGWRARKPGWQPSPSHDWAADLRRRAGPHYGPVNRRTIEGGWTVGYPGVDYSAWNAAVVSYRRSLGLD